MLLKKRILVFLAVFSLMVTLAGFRTSTPRRTYWLQAVVVGFPNTTPGVDHDQGR